MINTQTKQIIRFLNKYDQIYQSLHQVPISDSDDYGHRFNAFCKVVGNIDVMSGKINWYDVKRILDRFMFNRVKNFDINRSEPIG
jgi:hypothetical protein